MDEIEACLAVLARLAADPDDPALAPVRLAVEHAHRSGKKSRRAARTIARREHDAALLATTTRHREVLDPPLAIAPVAPAPVTPAAVTPAAVTLAPAGTLRGERHCYVCKARYRAVDPDYHMLCPDCAALNRARREARCELTGRRALVTGGRIKIGFHTALKLLRDGATVAITTRFPDDAAARYAAEPDAASWRHRLEIHAVDFLVLPSVQTLVETLTTRWPALDILINNAAQTIARPPAYHRALTRPHAGDLAVFPHAGPQRLPDRQLAELFPAGRVDETGEPLDLRGVNSWVLGVGEVTPREWLEVHVVNAFVPFLLTGQLRGLLAASPHPDRYVVQVSAMEGSFGRARKTDRHPHTNMAKASLNMLTRTVAGSFAAQGIYMSSVDTGWVTDERPHPAKQEQRAAGFRPPLDVLDGAARVYDPVVRGVAGDPVWGVLLKDYREAPW